MELALPTSTALVLVDLQHGITAMPTQPPAEDVVARAAGLAAAFRASGRPVALVRVDPLAAGAPETDAPPPPLDLGPQFTRLREELGSGDVEVTKPGWDAFLGTGLDVQLRRRGVTTLVLAGIRTAIGVESTARTAFGLGYGLVFAADACGEVDAGLQERCLRDVFPRLGRVRDGAAVLAALQAGDRAAA